MEITYISPLFIGVAGIVKQGSFTVCGGSCLSVDGSLALLNDAAFSLAYRFKYATRSESQIEGQERALNEQ